MTRHRKCSMPSMTSTSSFVRGLLALSLYVAGCAVDAPTDNSQAELDGSAAAYAAVEAGQCKPDCTNRVCGLDPVCGVSCGECRTGQACDDSVGQCKAECVPDCSGRTCGVDPVCGVSCGTCGAGSSCDDDSGTCQAEPSKPPTGHSCWKRFWFLRHHKH